MGIVAGLYGHQKERVMFTIYRCEQCKAEVQHPSMLRSIPWCQACEQPMEKVA